MQNSKRYWLRVGIIFALIDVVIHLADFILSDGSSPGDFLLLSILNPAAFVLNILDYLSVVNARLGFGGSKVFFLLLGGVQAFVVGIVLGWFYGKIKNRKKDVSPTIT